MMRYLLVAVLALSLFGCKSLEEKYSQTAKMQKMSADKLYLEGKNALAKGNYATAAKYFEALDAQYPFGKYSEQSLLNLIYARYKAGDTVQSAAIAQRYIHLYPRSRHVDYAYYMKGISNFEQDYGVIRRYMPVDPALRDMTGAKEAYNDLNVFLQRFPRSRYVRDARQRLIYLRNMFARKELYAARYYFKRNSNVAAINRAARIVQQYQQAPQSEEALAIMVKANRRLGLTKEANEAFKVLRATYPQSKFISRLS